MPTTSTTQAVWRSLGGDQSKTAYAGSMLMVADFYFSVAAAANSLAQRSATDTRPVVLPVGAVVVDVDVNVGTVTGGTSPTFDIGHRLYNSGTNSTGSLVNEGVASAAKLNFNWSNALAGASLGVAMSATQMVYLTASQGASAASSGTATGRVYYYVPTDGAVS